MSVRRLLEIAGGIAALAAAFVVRPFMSAEYLMVRGFGLFADGPVDRPAGAAAWFSLLAERPLVAVVLLDGLDLVYLALAAVLFMGFLVRVSGRGRVAARFAALLLAAGIALSALTNPAPRMFALARGWDDAPAGAARDAIAAEADAVIAAADILEPCRAAPALAGLALVYCAGLSAAVGQRLQAGFGRLTPWAGVLANAAGLALVPVLLFAPAAAAIPPSVSALFRVVWHVGSGVRLLGRKWCSDKNVAGLRNEHG